MIELLIECGADIHVVDQNGNTLLHDAVRSANRNMVEFIVGLEVNICARDSSGRTAFDLAKLIAGHIDPTIDACIRLGKIISADSSNAYCRMFLREDLLTRENRADVSDYNWLRTTVGVDVCLYNGIIHAITSDQRKLKEHCPLVLPRDDFFLKYCSINMFLRDIMVASGALQPPPPFRLPPPVVFAPPAVDAAAVDDSVVALPPGNDSADAAFATPVDDETDFLA
jgi:hypothetical protein